MKTKHQVKVYLVLVIAISWLVVIGIVGVNEVRLRSSKLSETTWKQLFPHFCRI